MEKADSYQVRKLNPRKEYLIQVPGSKSITNRAFLLAALSGKKCVLSGVLFSDDTRGFLDCLIQLGFRVEIKEEKQKVTIHGTDGRIPNPEASINVEVQEQRHGFLRLHWLLQVVIIIWMHPNRCVSVRWSRS